MFDQLKERIESKHFERFIIFIIILNAITLGLETSVGISDRVLQILHILDSIFLLIFTVELTLKLIVYKKSFFRDSWRVFDFVVVAISLLATSGPFSVIRALRILRALRMLSVIPSLKVVIDGLFAAAPGLGSVGAIMSIIFYVSSVIATKLFGNDFPDWFGSLPESGYSLFQIMTLESWSMGIVRPILEKFPLAWLFFLPFILIATFTMLNLFIAVIVSAMQSGTEEKSKKTADESHEERMQMMETLQDLKSQVAILIEQTKQNEK